MTRNNSWNFDTTYSIGDILYASSTSQLSKLPIGATNQVLGISAGLPTWQNANFPIDSQNFSFFEDALGNIPALFGGMGQNGYLDTSNDTPAIFSNVPGHPGTLLFTTGTSSSTFGALFAAIQFVFGAGIYTINFFCKITTLSTSGQRFTVRFGYTDTVGSGSLPVSNGCWFEYADNVNSGNWQVKCMSNSTATTANTSTAVDTNWHKFTIQVNANATSVAFYIDDVQVSNSPITTNIPLNPVYPTWTIKKSAGSTARTFQFDWYDHTVNLTNPRY